MTQQPAPAPRPRKRRGLLSQIFSHLMFGAVAVVGVVSYLNWDNILKYTGSRVCSYDVLGKYASQPPKVPPINLDKPAKAPPAPPEAPRLQEEKSFAASLEEVRQLFWANDPETVATYKKLIANNPENADLQSELGNVYFKFGQKDQAADQYLVAGKLFANQANAAKVSEMVRILEKFAPEKAKELSLIDVEAN